MDRDGAGVNFGHIVAFPVTIEVSQACHNDGEPVMVSCDVSRIGAPQCTVEKP